MRVVTAYTPDYEPLAKRLIESCDRFGQPFYTVPFSDKGSWAANCNFKPTAILQAMRDTGEDCLWLDADMELIAPLPEFPQPADCWLMRTIQDRVFDFTERVIMPNAHFKAVPWGGHMAFACNNRTRHLLAFWADICRTYTPDTNDEQCLLRTLEIHTIAYPEDGEIHIAPLPPPDAWLLHSPAGLAHGKPEAWRLV
jgi:hypothetical protein